MESSQGQAARREDGGAPQHEPREAGTITAEAFAALDLAAVTLVDTREPDEVLATGLEGAVNVPLAALGSGALDAIGYDKPVYVYCNTGDFSAEVAEILAERGHEAYNLQGGIGAYRAVLATPVEIDAKGLRCPGPIVKVADTLKPLHYGQRAHIEATEEAFASDLTVWCTRTGNKLVSLQAGEGVISAIVEKAPEGAPAGSAAADPANDKTFVVFSGDLDKTIAAFIMANGAAAMGRKVTMFFTFWGLNILRRPEKVNVAKTFVERAFGAMMPRGSKKLGLSRMNMLGAGPKMIRWMMGSKGISSLEELIEQAREHGVRLVACQMSMDIMGIHEEELIDGVELGGVATFIGSGETSDMSLFI